MLEEQWKPLRGRESEYEISNLGRVKRLFRMMTCKNGRLKTLQEKILTPQFNSTGYLWHQFPAEHKKEFRFVHRMVADAFVENPESKPFVNHKSGVKTENAAINLEWVTRKENVSHAFDTGLMSHAGEKNSQSKLTVDQVVEIRRLFTLGITRGELASQFNMSYSRIRDVVNNTCWKNAA